MSEAEDYLGPQASARLEIDHQLGLGGWVVQNRKQMNFGAGLGVPQVEPRRRA
jgi:hypothetical protein